MAGKLVFGKNSEGKIISINQAMRGLECACTCPECGDKLIARRGDKNAPHFAHLNLNERRKCIETALHLFGKQVIKDSSYIILPNGSKFFYSKVNLEEGIDGKMIVDALIGNDTEELAVEIVVTNPVSAEKELKMVSKNLMGIAIDLSRYIKHPVSEQELRTYIIDDVDSKIFIGATNPIIISSQIAQHSAATWAKSITEKVKDILGQVLMALFVALVLFGIVTLFTNRSKRRKF